MRWKYDKHHFLCMIWLVCYDASKDPATDYELLPHDVSHGNSENDWRTIALTFHS